MAERLTDKELSIEEYGKRSFLRPAQRQELERSLADIKQRLANPVLLEMAGGNRDALEKQAAKEQRMLANGTPPAIDSVTAAKMVKKLDKSTDLITNGQPTHTMMERGRPADVDHFVAHENARWQDREDGNYTTKRAILARQNYLLTLDPHNVEPNFLTQSVLRTDTVRGDPAKFRRNYDFIQFREQVEESIAAQLDDEAYYMFCGLKALEWSEATIRRKFDWSQKMYDAAMERWRADKGGSPEAENPEPAVPEGSPASTLTHLAPILEARGVTIDAFCAQIGIPRKTFDRYERSGWSGKRYMEALAWLRTDPAHPSSDAGEPGRPLVPEPAVLSFGEPAEAEPA